MDVLSIISLYFIISSVLLGVLDGCRSIQDIQAGTKNLQTPSLLRKFTFCPVTAQLLEASAV